MAQIETRGLTRTFGDVRAVDGVDLVVRPGGLTGFVGGNGAGKTTTMRMIMGVLRPDAGEVLWGDRPMTAADRQRFGYMPEERGLYPKQKVAEQLAYLGQLSGMSSAAAKSAVAEHLELFSLGDRAGERVEALSLGNQQRVQIIAALMHGPTALILDEPFSGLDPAAVDAMADILRDRAASGVPVLFSSHQLDLVERLCDSLIVLARGRVVAQGTVETLRAGGPTRYRLVTAGDVGPGHPLLPRHPGGDGMSPQTTQPSSATEVGQPWLLVARREVATKLVDRSFLVGTLLTLALIIGFVVLQAVLAERTRTYDVVVTSSAQTMADAVASQAPTLDDGIRVTVVPAADDAAAEGVRALPLLLDRPVKVRDAVLTQNADRAGTSVAALTAGTTLESDVLVGDADQRGFAQGMAFALAVLFYMASLIFGMTLANSVVEEKQSRIVEIIATKIPVRHLLAGKIAGNTVLAVGQMALYAAIGLVGLRFTPYSSFLPSVSGALGWFLVFFLLGFLLISCLWAVAGALASRTEDVQSTSTPVTMLLVAIFFGSLLLDGPAQTVLSYVPPASAILMPQRVLEGSAQWWEPLVALGILAVAAGAVVLLAERLYRRSLLQTQGRLSIRRVGCWSSQPAGRCRQPFGDVRQVGGPDHRVAGRSRV